MRIGMQIEHSTWQGRPSSPRMQHLRTTITTRMTRTLTTQTQTATPLMMIRQWQPVGSSSSFLFEFRGVNAFTAFSPDTEGNLCKMLVFSFSSSGPLHTEFMRFVSSLFFLRSLLSNSLSSHSSTMNRDFSRMPLATSLPPSMTLSSRHFFILQLFSWMSCTVFVLARFSRASRRAKAFSTRLHSLEEPSKIFQHGGRISFLFSSSFSVLTARLCSKLFGAFHFSLDKASCTICSTSDLGFFMATGVRLLILDPRTGMLQIPSV
mmetsp:Transcript_4477/g.5609  ORF Transcript_4477/g.5609 Transcript_4477/m.5609 type:complete len:264 (+) Transcript_4477:125-916(+)